jgi:hypothetical protein
VQRLLQHQLQQQQQLAAGNSSISAAELQQLQDWHVIQDRSDGEWYFYNSVTGESSWDLPEIGQQQ